MRDVNYGWLVRYSHSNGASFFFICVYIHIARGLYYGSYTKPRVGVWTVGVIIYLVMTGIAFLGYVLPWGCEYGSGASYAAVGGLGIDVGAAPTLNPGRSPGFSAHTLK